ncbi:hypothetical protein V7S79_11270 [Aquirufa sp. ROCK-SH2]
MLQKWKVLKNTLIPEEILFLPAASSFQLVKTFLDKEGLYFASYTSQFDQKVPSDFWYIINDQLLNLDDYPTKVRNEIRQSLKRCQLILINPLDYWDILFKIYQTTIDSYSHYSYKFKYDQFKETIMSNIAFTDIWLISDADNLPIGYGHIIRKSNYVDLFDIKIDPSKLKNMPVFGLLYELNRHYLSQSQFGFISDGRRSLFHDTNFQGFLEKKFLYRKAYCDLHIIYSSRIAFIMPILRIFRPILYKLPAWEPFRKLQLLINYDRIAKSVK